MTRMRRLLLAFLEGESSSSASGLTFGLVGLILRLVRKDLDRDRACLKIEGELFALESDMMGLTL